MEKIYPREIHIYETKKKIRRIIKLGKLGKSLSMYLDKSKFYKNFIYSIINFQSIKYHRILSIIATKLTRALANRDNFT